MRTTMFNPSTFLLVPILLGISCGESADAELISYYFQLNNAEVRGFASYQVPPSGSQLLINNATYRTVAYPLEVFSFVWDGTQYVSGEAEDPPYIAVRDGKPAVSFSWDDVRLDAITSSTGGVQIDASLTFEGPDGENTTLISNDLPTDLAAWPHLGGPVFRGYRDDTRVLFDVDARFGVLTDLAPGITNTDVVWLGGSGEFERAGAWSSGAVPSVFDKILFSCTPPSAAPETISLGRDAIVREIGFLGDRHLKFALNRSQLNVGSNLVLGEQAGERQQMSFANGGVAANRIVVGKSGTGELTIEDQTRLTSPLVIAEQAGSLGEVSLAGSQTHWEITYHLKPVVVGQSGKGKLTIADGAMMSLELGLDPDVIIAEQTSSEGEVLVAGAGSQLLVGGELVVGAGGNGTLKVRDGARVAALPFQDSAVSRLLIGGTQFNSEAAQGSVEVQGVGTRLLADDVEIGVSGRASLLLTDGATIHSSTLAMGRDSSSVGSLTVSGSGSVYEADSLFPVRIGQFGRAMVTVQDGAKLRTHAQASVARLGSSDEPSTVLIDNALWFSGTPTEFGPAGNIDLQWNSLLVVKNGGVVSTGNLAAKFNSIVQLDDGYLDVSHFELDTSARLLGNGVIHGWVVSDGLIAPGSSPGVLSFESDFTQTAGGVLQIELGSGRAGVDYDLVEVAGTATLGGALELILLPGFTPAPYEAFKFLTASKVVGEFASYDLPDLGESNQVWQVRYGFGAINLAIRPEASDLDGDGLMSAADLDALSAAVRDGLFEPLFDLNADGVLDGDDRRVWVEDLAGSLPGDADLDGDVQLDDFNLLKTHFGAAGGWGQGDFDGDGVVALADFSMLKEHFGEAAAVPEPATLILAAIGMAILTASRRRHCA